MTVDVAQMRSVMGRILMLRLEAAFTQAVRRPRPFRHAAMGSTSHLALLVGLPRLEAHDFANILSVAYRSLGLTHLKPR